MTTIEQQQPARILREFSAGPCIRVGEIVRETASSWFYLDRPRNGVARVARKSHGDYHAEPCKRCRDHPQTQYPTGHTD